ncbi:hypothetical protein V8G54_023790 [Vigna mungo]|uniref:Uncharacterized protein n=1 Tax=Vigna mungo TaxID=3915 RepID=A0AAQ3N4S1_VIGMU
MLLAAGRQTSPMEEMRNSLQPPETPKSYPIKHSINKKIIVGGIAGTEYGFRLEANRSRRLTIRITDDAFGTTVQDNERKVDIKEPLIEEVGFLRYLKGFMLEMSFLRGTLMDLKRRSGAWMIGRLGKNLARKVRIWGMDHLGLTLSEILHMGATKTMSLKGSGERKWMRRQMEIGEVLELGVFSFDIELKNERQSCATKFTEGTKALRPSEWSEAGEPRLGEEDGGCLESPGDVVIVAVDHEDDDTWGDDGAWICIMECVLALTGDAFSDDVTMSVDSGVVCPRVTAHEGRNIAGGSSASSMSDVVDSNFGRPRRCTTTLVKRRTPFVLKRRNPLLRLARKKNGTTFFFSFLEESPRAFPCTNTV